MEDDRIQETTSESAKKEIKDINQMLSFVDITRGFLIGLVVGMGIYFIIKFL